MPKSMVLVTLLLLVVMLMTLVASGGCQQAGLSEEEIKSIVHKEVVAELSQLQAEVAQLKAQNEELNRRVMSLEGELQLGKAANTEDIAICLGDIVHYIDNLNLYLNDVSEHIYNLNRYVKGFADYLPMPPPGPPSWIPNGCLGY